MGKDRARRENLCVGNLSVIFYVFKEYLNLKQYYEDRVKSKN